MVEPFVIAWIDAPGSGRIGISRLPGRSGELEGDLAAASAAGATIVLTMNPATELAAKGVPDLPLAAVRAGLAWRHFPIPDYGAPQDGERWGLIGPELHAALDRGQAILLHCAGGKGRSGMVAARLLAERGVASETAIAAVRTARPGAIETVEQEWWVAAGA